MSANESAPVFDCQQDEHPTYSSLTALAARRGGRRAGAGRPTAYRTEYADSLRQFFIDRLAMIKTGDGECLRAPSFEEYARTLGISDETFRKWRKRHSDFMCAYGTARYLRELALDELRRLE